MTCSCGFTINTKWVVTSVPDSTHYTVVMASTPGTISGGSQAWSEDSTIIQWGSPTDLTGHNVTAFILGQTFQIWDGPNAGTQCQLEFQNATTLTTTVTGTCTLAAGADGWSFVTGHTDCGQYNHQNTATLWNVGNITIQNYACINLNGSISLQPLLLQTSAFVPSGGATISSTSGTTVNFSAPTTLYKNDFLNVGGSGGFQWENQALAMDVVAPTAITVGLSCTGSIATAVFTLGTQPPISTGDRMTINSSISGLGATSVPITTGFNSSGQPIFTYANATCPAGNDTSATFQDPSGGTQGTLFHAFSGNISSPVSFFQVKSIVGFFSAGYLVDANQTTPEIAQINGAVIDGFFGQSTYLNTFTFRNASPSGSAAYGGYALGIYDGVFNKGTASLGCDHCINQGSPLNTPQYPSSQNDVTTDTNQMFAGAARGTNFVFGTAVTFDTTGLTGDYKPTGGTNTCILAGYKGNPNIADGTPFLPFDVFGNPVNPAGSCGATQP